ncbi:MAG: glutathione peroxidase [Pseudomonadales bacterium]|nr:glutathione peroxidase [Pseudomonadales bacterium]
MSAFHKLDMADITGEAVKFTEFKGQLCLVVNVASACGLTPQYAGLNALHNDNKNLTVLGFPCNQFGAQEPGSEAEIQDFVQSKFNLNFPLFSKIEVNGENTCALYQFLKSEKTDEEGKADIAWNFTKFLVNGEGQVVERFGPTVTPEQIAEKLISYQ